MSLPLVLLALLGLAIVLAVLFDVVTTTLSTKGAGPLSGLVAGALWGAALAAHRRWPSHRRLSYLGMIVMVGIIVFWTALMWLGWWLVFLSVADAVVLASSGDPVRPLEVLYFTGYTLITLGNGEYRPEGELWQVATVLASATGFFVVTLAVTFLLSVLPAVVAKRKIAGYIAALGRRPEDILLRHWDGTDCSALVEHVPTLMSALSGLAQQHLAFPVLHYFHASESRSALALRVAALDEALFLLCHGLEGCRDAALRVAPLRNVIEELLLSLQEVFHDPEREAPPPRSLSALERAGLPVTSASGFAAALEQSEQRRRSLLGFVRRDGWEWTDIDGAQ